MEGAKETQHSLCVYCFKETDSRVDERGLCLPAGAAGGAGGQSDAVGGGGVILSGTQLRLTSNSSTH